MWSRYIARICIRAISNFVEISKIVAVCIELMQNHGCRLMSQDSVHSNALYFKGIEKRCSTGSNFAKTDTWTLMIELVVICQFLSRNVKHCKCSIFSVLNAWMQWIHNNARQRQVYNWHVNTVTSAITTINMAFVAFDFMLQWSHLWCGLKIILCVKRKCTD